MYPSRKKEGYMPLLPSTSLPPPGSASGPPGATLRAAWSVHAPIPQRLVCAGVNVYAPSATAAGHSGGSAISPSKDAPGAASAAASPARDGVEGERYASVWWPQHREQRQRHYAGGMPAVGQEKLRHTSAVTGLQWSPGVLQKDALSIAAAGSGGGGAGGASPGGTGAASDPASPSGAAAAATTDAEDHPALMTTSEDGAVRVWVETLVLTESSALPCLPGQPSPDARSQQTPPKPPPQLRRRSPSPGGGSPGAAPSSPRDVRAAAAAAAALGAAAPAITSYFCMALLIDPAATAAGAAAAAAAAVAGAAAGGGTADSARTPRGLPLPQVALWARHAGALLLHKQQRRVAAPVLWLFTATVEHKAGDSTCRLLLHLHAVRGLAAIIMSAGYGGSLSSTSGGSSSTRPAAVLWGRHAWELPAAAAGTSPAALLQQLCCWVSDEEGYPLLHTFTSGGGAGRPLLAGRTFSTVQEEGPLSHMQVHKQLAVASSWQAAAVAHEHPITAFAGRPAEGSSGGTSSVALVASCDSSGRLLLWEGPHLRHLAAVPAAAVGSTAALAWLPLGTGVPAAVSTAREEGRQELWLAVGSGSMLQCYSIGVRPPVAVATAALPAGCSAITSLHAFNGGGGGSSSPTISNTCLLLAVCSSSTGRGSMACAWRCAVGAAPSSGAPSSMQLAPAGTVAVPLPAAVTAAALAGGDQLLVGTADGAVQLLAIVAEGRALQLQPVASVQDEGAVSAIAADEGCLHLATACGSAASVWSAATDSSNTSSADLAACGGSHYERSACVALPPGAGDATAVAWMSGTVAPCLAVATSSGSILLLSAVRGSRCSINWRWVARLPTGAGTSTAIRQLAAGSGCSSVLAAAGNQVLRLSETVCLPSAGQDGGGTTVLLGRMLLDAAGPLPQYHPTFLAALLLSGKRAMAAAVLQRLAAWLTVLRQHAEASGGEGGTAASQPPSPEEHGSGTSPAVDGLQGSAGGAELSAPLFLGLPLAELVDAELAHVAQLLDRRVKSGATARAGQGAPQQQPRHEQQQHQQQPAVASLDSGVLDMAAFGMAPPAPPAAPQQPAASSVDSGMLDMAAFGMAPPAPPAAPQQPAASSVGSGMLDMAAFGMAPPALPAAPPARAALATPSTPPRQQAQRNGSTAAAPGNGAAVQQLPPAPEQELLSATQLLPVASECYRQLQELLLPPSSEDDSEELFRGEFGAGGTREAASQSTDQLAWATGASAEVAAVIPGLSLEETSAVLAIAGAFAQGEAGAAGTGASTSTAPLDTAAAQYVAAVGLACATGSRGSSGGGAGQQPKPPQAQQRVTVMNAAGVAYTLAPSAVVGRGDGGDGSDDVSMGQAWGLLPGLEASAVLWALLSGTEEPMLQQALRRLQQCEAAAATAAAAAESADTAAFLSMRAANRPEQGGDQAPSWEQLRRLGAGFWLRDAGLLAGLAERLAKQQFAARRNADDCALLYCALGKRSVLQGLYRSTQNRKLSEFLSRDFSREQNRQAAQKNAFVLLGQHRAEMAAAFFIVGDCPHEAVGVAANELRDPQLALLLCCLLFGACGSPAEARLLQQLQHTAEASSASDAAAAAAVCCWMRADAEAVVRALLRGEQSRLAAAATAEHAAQLLPLLRLVLTAVPPAGDEQAGEWRRHLQRCLWALAAALRRCGLHSLAVQAAAAAQLGDAAGNGRGHREAPRRALLQHHLLAEALLPGVLEQHHRQRRHLDADAAYQLELLQQQGVAVDAPAVLSRLRHARRGILSADEHQRALAWAPPLAGLGRQQSSVGSVGGSSFRSRDAEPPRWQQQRHGTAVVADGQVLFRVDHDKLEGVACCPLMSPDVLGRPVVVASHRMGLVEGQLHVVPPEPLSPLHEVPDSPTAAAAALLEEEQQQRGGMFSRLLSQLFDQSTWQQDPTWHHGTGTSEFDVVGAAAEGGLVSPHSGRVAASNVHTATMAAHPQKQLYLTGCTSGLLHLWQFGEQHALATYTPVPGSELANIARTFSGLLSFSRSFKTSAAAPRLANWGKAAAVRFAPSGERFAAVGEGGVVATWRLDAPSRQADGDGHGCAEWWHQALSKQGCAVDFVGGSSSVLVVGGRSLPTASAGSPSSNLSVWDTTAPTASSCVGRLTHHQATVTTVTMLPGGWLLAAGDAEGGLSCTDLRMIGGSSGPRLLWSVKAARGSVRAIAAIESGGAAAAGLRFGGSGGGALLATAGGDGAVRIWRGSDGRLLQGIETAHFTARPGSAGSRRSSHDGGAPVSPALGGHAPPGSHPAAVTGLAVCEEGLVSCGADGCVRLYGFV